MYAYAGMERFDVKFFNVGGMPFGYGNPNYDNAGCFFPGATSFADGTAPLGWPRGNRNYNRSRQNIFKSDSAAWLSALNTRM